MKTMLYNCLFLLLLPVIAFAGTGKGKYNKEKNIHKIYAVTANAMLDVNNKYGNVSVVTWDEDKTEIDVVIKVSGNNEALVTQKLNAIDVAIETTKSLVKAVTTMGNVNGKLSFEINYTVKIPKMGSLKLTNQYGNIFIGTLNGKTDISCKYGDLSITALKGNANSISLSYSSATRITSTGNCTINASYSNVIIKAAGDLNLTGGYTDFVIGTADDITYAAAYGKLDFAEADKVTGTGNYLTIKLGIVKNLINISTKYTNITVNSLQKTMKNIAINAAYTNVDLKYAKDLSFEFEAILTYGSLKGSGNLTFQEKNEKGKDNYYKGYHNSTGGARIYINDKYGNVTLTKNN